MFGVVRTARFTQRPQRTDEKARRSATLCARDRELRIVVVRRRHLEDRQRLPRARSSRPAPATASSCSTAAMPHVGLRKIGPPSAVRGCASHVRPRPRRPSRVREARRLIITRTPRDPSPARADTVQRPGHGDVPGARRMPRPSPSKLASRAKSALASVAVTPVGASSYVPSTSFLAEDRHDGFGSPRCGRRAFPLRSSPGR